MLLKLVKPIGELPRSPFFKEKQMKQHSYPDWSATRLRFFFEIIIIRKSFEKLFFASIVAL